VISYSYYTFLAYKMLKVWSDLTRRIGELEFPAPSQVRKLEVRWYQCKNSRLFLVDWQGFV
jgi:hypothetical protein